VRNSGQLISPYEVHLIPSPIAKVLSTIHKHGVKALVMGGQACVLCGAAESGRDTDLVSLADSANLRRLQSALDELHTDQITVP
jgi:hypothetical protein